jgi:hypothetical protein
MSIGVAYGSPAPPEEIKAVGTKKNFVTKTVIIGTSETTLTIPVGALSYQIRVDGNQELTLSNVLGGTNVIATRAKLPKDNTWSELDLNLTSALTIYIKSSTANTNVELIYWTT